MVKRYLVFSAALTFSIAAFSSAGRADALPTSTSSVAGSEVTAPTALSAQSATVIAQIESTEPTTGTYTEQRRWPNRPLMLTSATMFVLSYVPTVIATAANSANTTNDLYIPIAGPWMEMARDDNTAGNKALLALSGIFQGLGALGLVTSFFVPESKTKNWYLMGQRHFSMHPMAARDQYGLAARGSF